MQKNLLNSDERFDKTIKDSLGDLDVPYSTDAWASIENAISEPPASGGLKKFNFNLNTTTIGFIAGAITLAGIGIWAFSGKEDASTVEPKPITIAPAKTIPSSPANYSPFVYNDSIPLPAIKQEAIALAPFDKNDLDGNLSPEEEAEKTNREMAENAEPANPSSSDAKQNEPNEEESFETTLDKNRPIFGDQIDPIKGIVKPTQEADGVRKIASDKDPHNWDEIKMERQKDSIRKKNMLDSLMKMINPK